MKKIVNLKDAYGLEECSVYREKSDGSHWRLGKYCNGGYDAKNEKTGKTARLTPHDLIGDYVFMERELWITEVGSGNLIMRVNSIDEGVDMIYELEEDDKEAGVYEEEAYEISLIER